MEINSAGNAALLNRPPADTSSGDTASKSGAVGAGSVSKQTSGDPSQGTLVPPPTPVAETGPEDNTVQTKENGAGGQLRKKV